MNNEIIKIVNKYVLVTGIKANKPPIEILDKIDYWDRLNGTETQLINAENIAGKGHLKMAATLAVIAHQRGLEIARKLKTEILLYASAQHQIDKAIKMMGVGRETENVAVVIVADRVQFIKRTLKKIEEALGGKQDPQILNISPAKERRIIKIFNISPNEMAALNLTYNEASICRAVMSRMALIPIMGL